MQCEDSQHTQFANHDKLNLLGFFFLNSKPHDTRELQKTQIED